MKPTYKDLKDLIQTVYLNYQRATDEYIKDNPNKDLDKDLYFDTISTQERTIRWLLWDIEELEGKDNE